MENADRQIKHAVVGKKVAERQRDEYATENKRLKSDVVALKKNEIDMRRGLDVLLTNQKLNVEHQMKRDEQAAEEKRRQDAREERLEKEREAQRKRDEKAAKEK